MDCSKISILIAPNSFKECADSVEIANWIFKSLSSKLSGSEKYEFDFALRPISDGGDGFLKVCTENFNLNLLTAEIHYPFGSQKFNCPFGISPSLKKIFIESAKVLGLNLIPPEKRDPSLLTSAGMGELLLYLTESKNKGELDFEEVVIGIGGTGTNDLGIGMMGQLGVVLIDKTGKTIEPLPANFLKAARILNNKRELPFKINVVADVQNPLLGENGASIVFAPQKGASVKEAHLLDSAFDHILNLLGLFGPEKKKLNGAGGGIAAALQIFYNAAVKSSAQFIKHDLGIRSENSNFQIVVTGEGKLDLQTGFEKGTKIIANEFKDAKRIFIICGRSENSPVNNPNIEIIELADWLPDPQQSIENIEYGIDLACERITRFISQSILRF